MPRQKYPAIAIYCLITLMLAFFASNRLFRGDPEGWKLIISSDGLGYYAYLPAFLIDRDPSFKKVTERETKILGYDKYKPSYLVNIGNRTVDKYFAGEAILLLPFFLIATLLSWMGGLEISGYSFFFQLFTGLGALFYLFLGLYYLKKILEYFRTEPILSAILIPSILLATNLFFYTLWRPSMSHVYSFFAINGFLWFCCRAIQNPRVWNFMLVSLFLGITVMIRPTNGIVIFLVPFLFQVRENIPAFPEFLKKHKSFLLILPAGVIIFMGIQSLLWHIQTGRWMIWSYQDEGFYFGYPEVTNVLFSYRKGLFIYTPLIFIACLGLFRLWFIDRVRFTSAALFIFLSVWIIAAWWNWPYGDGFGLRAFIDGYGFYALLLAVLLNHRWTRLSTPAVILIMLPFVALNLLQTWQYTEHILLPDGMNRENYRYVFLKTDSAYRRCLRSVDELPGYRMDMLHPCKVFRNNFETVPANWSYSMVMKTSSAHSGTHVGLIDSVHHFSSTLLLRPERLSSYPAIFYVEGSFWIRDSLPGASNKAKVILSMDSISPHGFYYYAFPVNPIPVTTRGIWRNCRFSMTLPEFQIPGHLLKIYIWQTGNKPVLIDDFSLVFFTEQKKPAAD